MPPKRSSPNKTPATKGTRITPKNSRSKNNSAPADKITTTQGHLKREHYHIIINWLSVKKNYVACFGDDQAPKVGRPAKGNINGYELMAINIRNQSNPKIILTSRQMKDRFKAYRIKSKKAHTKSLSTGFGLTSADQKAEIKTIAEKLDKMCPLYAKLVEVIAPKKSEHSDHSNQICLEEEAPGGPVTQQSDYLPSGDEVLNPGSKSKTKKKAPHAPVIDQENSPANNNSLESPLKKSVKKRKKRFKTTTQVTPANRSNNNESEYLSTPPKESVQKRKKRKSRGEAGLTAAERALDDVTEDDSSESPLPSPNKGKRCRTPVGQML
ncbi:hypothetical protein MJO28_003480 [Puccinia striiformis f. sp. tritici]|uniref:Uncharacterized protein n=1 Tax=Puccinia striiformis f. sp. tritici TaxID=168172 RepID=A0ACC0ETA5_9BASI|nr:hypothetical protein MJO28_003480 [Puccinia striiformis f. sp. tritici]